MKLKLLICDVSALRDLGKLELLSQLPRLPYKTRTTSLAWSSSGVVICDDKPPDTLLNPVFIEKPTEASATEAFRLRKRFRGLTLADSAVLNLALNHEAVLLSSDPFMRMVAAKLGLEIMEYNQLFHEMVVQGILTLTAATEKYYELYYKVNRSCATEEQGRIVSLPLRSELQAAGKRKTVG